MEEGVERAPLFIKIEEYKDVIDIMGIIKEKIKVRRNFFCEIKLHFLFKDENNWIF